MGININLFFQLEPQNEEGAFIRSEVIFLKIPIRTPSMVQNNILSTKIRIKSKEMK